MQKIPSLFIRRDDQRDLVNECVTPGCEWVINGEGVATVKWDGTACKIEGGRLFRRYDAKLGRTPPADFEPCQDAPDAFTGHWPGWVPVTDLPEDRWHRQAFLDAGVAIWQDGTYELVGPKIGGNPYGWDCHMLVPHGADPIERHWQEDPRSYLALAKFFEKNRIEGIVWHHPDARMAKIKAKDFGYEWPVKKSE